MILQKQINLIKEVGEEILTEEELKILLEKKEHPVAYDGFEPSGTNIHIAQGLLRAININKMTVAGCKFKMLIADWHAWANNKMAGDLEKIQKVGNFYIEVWKACDMDMKNIEFVWASDLAKDTNYWRMVMSVARNSTLQRILRTVEIMGRTEKEMLHASQIFYPCMQAADIFYLKANICQLGMDQRKVNVLAREVGEKIGFWKPVVVSHHMLAGLQEPMPKIKGLKEIERIIKEEQYASKSFQEICSLAQINLKEIEEVVEKYYPTLKNYFTTGNFRGDIETSYDSILIMEKRGEPIQVIKDRKRELKELFSDFQRQYFGMRQMSLKMSKSKPDSAIFMLDSKEDVERKIRKAYCPEKKVEENPIMEYCKYIIFKKVNSMKIKQDKGNLTIKNYEELENMYGEGKLHPMDLKAAVAEYLNQLLEPIRKKLHENKKAMKLYEEIKGFEVTR